MDKLQELIDRIEAREFSDVDEVYEAAIFIRNQEDKEKHTAPASLFGLKIEIDKDLPAGTWYFKPNRPASQVDIVKYEGKSVARSCNCVGPDKCGDKTCELVRKYEGEK